MHKVTIDQCAAYLVDAYRAVSAPLADALGLTVEVRDGAAPTSFEELMVQAGTGTLYIGTEHSATSIYGVDGNVAFRTMHDLGHIQTKLTFSTADEIALALHQWEELRRYIPVSWRERCQAVYQADTIMQSLYCERHGVFPTDQTAFIHTALQAYD